MRLGDLDLDDGVKDNALHVTIDVESRIPRIHPKYIADPPVNDIAVIKMKDRVNITGNKKYFLNLNTSLLSEFSAHMHSYASVVQNFWDYNIFFHCKTALNRDITTV